MIKNIRYAILKTREIYNRKMWCYCVSKAKKCECDHNYKDMYIWKDRAKEYENTRRFVTERIQKLGV